ncbi:MAG: DUF2007 domain-containing protein [Saprospiraceae bacterium]
MKEGWIKIFAHGELLQAKLAEDILKQAGIESHIVNKADSMFPTPGMGVNELYTPSERAVQARAVLTENEFEL